MDHHLMSSETLTLHHARQVIPDRLHLQICYSNKLGYYSCVMLPPKLVNFTCLPLNILHVMHYLN